MVVYGDLLFLINFSMDFLCFYLSCLLLHERMKTWRVCVASALGGVYSVASLFLRVKGSLAFIIDMLVLLLMCLTAYGIKRGGARSLFKRAFLYFFVSALLGGMMTALFSLFNDMEVLKEIDGTGKEADALAFSALAMVGSMLALRGGRIFRGSFSQRSVILRIENNGESVELCALVDSGNLVTEPISGKGVAFISVEKCKNLLENDLYNSIKNNSYIYDNILCAKYKIRLIPTSSVSGEAFLPALKFSRTAIVKGKEKRELDVYIALLSDGKLGKYDAIISHEAIT